MPHFQDLEKLLKQYFPKKISQKQFSQFEIAFNSYLDWNDKVNVISRKDIENLAERHFLHALAIAKAISFTPGTQILDAGTGGGFPGIPLAIFFPDTQFHLVDSREKKINVVQNIVRKCDIKNVISSAARVESLSDQYDFVVSRAVTDLRSFSKLLKGRVHCDQKNSLENGFLGLKGGNLKDEIEEARKYIQKYNIYALSDWFEQAFFSSKFLVHVPEC